MTVELLVTTLTESNCIIFGSELVIYILKNHTNSDFINSEPLIDGKCDGSKTTKRKQKKKNN